MNYLFAQKEHPRYIYLKANESKSAFKTQIVKRWVRSGSSERIKTKYITVSYYTLYPIHWMKQLPYYKEQNGGIERTKIIAEMHYSKEMNLLYLIWVNLRP